MADGTDPDAGRYLGNPRRFLASVIGHQSSAIAPAANPYGTDSCLPHPRRAEQGAGVGAEARAWRASVSAAAAVAGGEVGEGQVVADPGRVLAVGGAVEAARARRKSERASAGRPVPEERMPRLRRAAARRGVEREGPGVVVERLVGAAERLVGQGPVEQHSAELGRGRRRRGRRRRRRRTGRAGRRRGPGRSSARSPAAGAPGCGGTRSAAAAIWPGAEVGPAEVVVLPGRARRAATAVRRRRARPSARRGSAASRSSAGLGPKAASASSSTPRASRRGLGRRLAGGGEPDAEVGPDGGEVEQVGLDPPLDLGVERGAVGGRSELALSQIARQRRSQRPRLARRGGGAMP